MIRVFIADDHKMVIEGIQLLISYDSEIECVGFALNGKEALVLMASLQPDVVLMDINMPELNGIETCKALKKEYPQIKVIALSMLNESSMIKLMLKSGAEGYVLKNAGSDEVISAIKAVHNGKKFLSEEANETMMNDLFSNSNKPKKKSAFMSLSRREKEVLQLIIDEFSSKEIAEQLFISLGTVETHRRNMLSKLGAKNTAGLVRISLEFELLKD